MLIILNQLFVYVSLPSENLKVLKRYWVSQIRIMVHCFVQNQYVPYKHMHNKHHCWISYQKCMLNWLWVSDDERTQQVWNFSLYNYSVYISSKQGLHFLFYYVLVYFWIMLTVYKLSMLIVMIQDYFFYKLLQMFTSSFCWNFSFYSYNKFT